MEYIHEWPNRLRREPNPDIDYSELIHELLERGKNQPETIELYQKFKNVENRENAFHFYIENDHQLLRPAVKADPLEAVFQSQYGAGESFRKRIEKVIQSKKKPADKIRELQKIEVEMNQEKQPYPESDLFPWTGDEDLLNVLVMFMTADVLTVLNEAFPYGRLYSEMAKLYKQTRNETEREKMLSLAGDHWKADAGIRLELADICLKKKDLETAFALLKDAWALSWETEKTGQIWKLLMKYYGLAGDQEAAAAAGVMAVEFGTLQKKEKVLLRKLLGGIDHESVHEAMARINRQMGFSGSDPSSVLIFSPIAEETLEFAVSQMEQARSDAKSDIEITNHENEARMKRRVVDAGRAAKQELDKLDRIGQPGN